MATLHSLEKENLELIAKELGSWVVYIKDNSLQESCTTAHSMELCTMSVECLHDLSKSSAECLHATGTWHIQVRTNAGVEYFARTARPDGKAWKIYSFYGPGLARDIDNGLSQLDKMFDDSFKIRVVEIPPYLITGLTLEKEDVLHVYIAAMAPGLPLEVGRVYGFNDLRRRLMEVAPVRGRKVKKQVRK